MFGGVRGWEGGGNRYEGLNMREMSELAEDIISL